MASFKVKASLLNVRTEPVEEFANKKNIVGKLKKDAPFESIDEKTNKLGVWYKDANQHWVWGEGLLNISSENKVAFDFQGFINTCFDGQKLESEINYNQLLEIDDSIKLNAGEEVLIGILDHPISSSLHFNKIIQRPFPVGDPLFNFHGNFIAGLIGGINGIKGIANKSQIIELPIYNSRANSSGIDIDAILKSINQDDKSIIINISNKLENRYNDIIKNFKSNKIIIACAGINEELSSNIVRDPASQGNVLAIGAITKPLFTLPKLNDKIDFVVPNFNYTSFKKTENDFSRENGDSFSCAVVSAVIALLIASGKCDFNLSSIKEELKRVALPFSTENFSLFNIINVKS